MAGYVSDHFGRKPAFLFSLFLGCTFNLATSFVHSFAAHFALYMMASMWASISLGKLEFFKIQNSSVLRTKVSS